MQQLTAIIVDDEAPGRLMIRQLMKDHDDTLVLLAEAANGREAIRLISNLKPELIFLDIEMPDLNGFEVLSALSYQPIVVFSTAYDQFAIRAFKENAIDYLVKPVEAERFKTTVEKIKRFTLSISPEMIARMKELFVQSKPKQEATAIPVTIGNKIKLIRLSDLCYAKADGGYVDLVTQNNDTFLTERTLIDLEEFLPANFLRVQKSYIINKDKVREINRYFNNRFMITMDDESASKILSGKSYAGLIRQALNL